MARIDLITFFIGKNEYKSPVNVNMKGVFSIALNWEVKKALNMTKYKFEAKTKEDLLKPIYHAYHAYLESNKEFFLFISIQYKASKDFAIYKNGKQMWYYNQDTEFTPDGMEQVLSRLHFGYEIYCKEINSTDTEIWHAVEEIKDNDENQFNYPIIEGYYVTDSLFSIEGKLIPYTKEALNTLSKAKEGIRGISEILFTFINQDTELISAQLNAGNLLNSK